MTLSTACEPAHGTKKTGSRSRLAAAKHMGRPGTVALILAILAIVAVACGGGSNSDSDDADLASDFEFTLFQGEDKLGGVQKMNLHQLFGKPIVLNFWAGLCPPCRAEMPDLQEFYEEFNDRVTLVGIDLGQFTGLGSLDDAKELVEELGVAYPVGSTEDSSILSEYRVFGLPATMFIDADGNIFKNWGGALNADTLINQAEDMLSQ